MTDYNVDDFTLTNKVDYNKLMTDDFDLNWLAQGWLSWLQKIMLG